MSPLYFDNNATTRILPPVLEAMLPWLTESYGNPSSSHPLGQQAKQALGTARAKLAGFLKATPAEVIFTSGATESNHLAICSAALSADHGRRRIVSSAVEHPSTLLLLAHLQKQGFEVVLVPVKPSGELDLAALNEAVNENTALVTLMHANNETGVIFPIDEAAAIAHSKGALMHTDAAQTAGKIDLDVHQLGCDLLSFSGHKLHAPKGVGVLYAKKGIPVQPQLLGHQERNRRGGTENLPGIIGLAAAAELAKNRMAENPQKVSALRDSMELAILNQVPQAYVNGVAARVANTSNICFPGIDGEELLCRLERLNILASRGSACTAGGTEPSHVLLAMGRSSEEALASIRFSLSCETTPAEVAALAAAIGQVVGEIGLQVAA